MQAYCSPNQFTYESENIFSDTQILLCTHVLSYQDTDWWQHIAKYQYIATFITDHTAIISIYLIGLKYIYLIELKGKGTHVFGQ